MVIIHTTISHNETVTITVAPLGVVSSARKFRRTDRKTSKPKVLW
jgi:hypothetical protein